MKCPTCHRAHCRWLTIKNVENAATDWIFKVLKHNADYIEMLGRTGNSSAIAEESMYKLLEPLEIELAKRKGETT